MKTKISGTAAIPLGLSNTASSKINIEKKAGVIKIKDSKAIMAGNNRKEKDVFEISIEDNYSNK